MRDARRCSYEWGDLRVEFLHGFEEPDGIAENACRVFGVEVIEAAVLLELAACDEEGLGVRLAALDQPGEFFADRPWGKGNNPKTAVREFFKSCDRFVVDKDIEAKLLITVAPDGYLKCVKD